MPIARRDILISVRDRLNRRPSEPDYEQGVEECLYYELKFHKSELLQENVEEVRREAIYLASKVRKLYRSKNRHMDLEQS